MIIFCPKCGASKLILDKDLKNNSVSAIVCDHCGFKKTESNREENRMNDVRDGAS